MSGLSRTESVILAAFPSRDRFLQTRVDCYFPRLRQKPRSTANISLTRPDPRLPHFGAGLTHTYARADCRLICSLSPALLPASHHSRNALLNNLPAPALCRQGSTTSRFRRSSRRTSRSPSFRSSPTTPTTASVSVARTKKRLRPASAARCRSRWCVSLFALSLWLLPFSLTCCPVAD